MIRQDFPTVWDKTKTKYGKRKEVLRFGTVNIGVALEKQDGTFQYVYFVDEKLMFVIVQCETFAEARKQLKNRFYSDLEKKHNA